MEIKINKEINDYTDQIAWGLSVRQALFSGLAVVVAGVAVSFLEHAASATVSDSATQRDFLEIVAKDIG